MWGVVEKEDSCMIDGLGLEMKESHFLAMNMDYTPVPQPMSSTLMVFIFTTKKEATDSS